MKRHIHGMSHPPPKLRAKRCKRPLVILNYCDENLEGIYSSTPNVQFVRLDLSTLAAPHDPTDSFPTAASRQFTPLTLADLPAQLRHTAQRAFRKSAKR